MSGRWVHVREEDTDDEMVFRPAGTDLPPARGRMASSPRGRHLRGDRARRHRRTGGGQRQRALEGDTITLSEGATGVPREMEVVTADEDRLVIRKHRDGP